MDDQQMHDLLTEIAHEEIPNVNLWHEIQAQTERPRRNAMLLHRVVRIAAAVVILMTVTAGAYALYQELFGDPGLESVRDDITEIDETLPLPGEYGERYNIEVTLDYAYADANRVVVAYVITGEAPPIDQVQVWGDPDLKDASGRAFPYLPLGGGGGGGGGSADPNTPIPFRKEGLVNFDSSWLNEIPTALDLNLTISVAITTADMAPGEMRLAGQVNYTFTLPFNPGYVMDAAQTVTAGEYAITLQKVVVAPSLTRVELCYALPPLAESNPAGVFGWQPIGTLTIDGTTIAAERPFTTTPRAAAPDGTPCWTLNLPEGLNERTGAWTLTIHRFIEPNSEDPAEVVRILQAEGFALEVNPSGGYMMSTDLTETDTINQRLNQVIYEMQNKIEGEWVFDFSIE